MTSATFAELGIPFPLFEAPVEQASSYLGLGLCSLCGRAEVHCFAPSDLPARCPGCGKDTYLPTFGLKDGACPACGAAVPFPARREGERVAACYDCLRAGKAALTKDTEYGMVSWEQAREGLTHGGPGLGAPYPVMVAGPEGVEHVSQGTMQRPACEFELVPAEDDPDWMRARVPEEWLWELLRTPSFHTWQGERWLFCCRRPMAFAGEWDAEEFQRRSPDGDGWKLFQSVVEDAGEEVWNRLSSPDVGGPYVFRCPECERFSGYWDLS